jgi:hypothetical protein
VKIDPPAPRRSGIAEGGDEDGLLGEAAVLLGARDPDAVVAEADDVGAAVTGGVGHEARVAIDLPAARRSGKPKPATTCSGAVKLPSGCARETHTPSSANPTMSARPSPVVSARKRGWRSTR